MSKKAMIMLNQIFKNRFLLPGILVFLSGFMEAQHPFKFDSLYNTIYAKELCQLIQRDPDVVLIDVRSAGEFCDTSQYASLNKGHLKGAINIPVDSIKTILISLLLIRIKPSYFIALTVSAAGE